MLFYEYNRTNFLSAIEVNEKSTKSLKAWIGDECKFNQERLDKF